MLSLYVLIVSVLACLLVGGLVIASSVRDAKIRIYGVLSAILIVMSVANHLAVESTTSQLVYVRMVMFSSTVAIYLIYLLVISLRKRENRYIFYLDPILYLTVAVAVLDWTPVLFPDVITGKPPTPVLGSGIVLYFSHFIITLSLVIRLLYRDIVASNGDKGRRQGRLLFIGILPTLLLAPLTSFVLPSVFDVVQFVAFTPLYVFIFVSCVGYAIVRHGLFDIKLAAVRSVAYGLSILALGGIYYAVAYLVSVAFFQGEVSSSFSLSPLNILLALALAFIFQPIKRFFDKTTDKIFFRDRYDPEDFYARLNEILASTTDLRNLLRRASSEVASTLKAEKALFYVQYNHVHHVSAGTKGSGVLPRAEALELDEYIKSRGDGVIVEALLPDGDSIKRLMISHDLSVILPLVQKKKPLGYLLLGQQMGGMYNTRDVRALETIVDSLIIAIKNSLSVQEVKDLNENLQQRIDAATQELKASNARLRYLDTTKDEFLSMASHQLRTPLTSVKGYLSMVLDGDAGKITATQRKLLSEAFDSSERMVHLVHDFLNVSRLQTGKFMLELHPTDMVEMVKQEVDLLRQAASARGITLDYKPDDSIPQLMADETKLRQVVMNYVDNALYYSRDLTRPVEITLKKIDNRLELRVIDSGIGVPKSEQAQLFSKFYRASNARTQRPDGTGVGIYLAKKVVTEHGGDVIFESVEGEGSTFGFWLPLNSKTIVEASGEEPK